jgi:PadR family transcriptional regulator, regulatory protein PadR
MTADDNSGESNPPPASDLVQGTLEMLILKTLALEPMHGYGVALRIEQVSRGVFRVNPGSLLPALSRMERAGRIRSEWRATENNRRAKYYKLTVNGHKALTGNARTMSSTTSLTVSLKPPSRTSSNSE